MGSNTKIITLIFISCNNIIQRSNKYSWSCHTRYIWGGSKSYILHLLRDIIRGCVGTNSMHIILDHSLYSVGQLCNSCSLCLVPYELSDLNLLPPDPASLWQLKYVAATVSRWYWSAKFLQLKLCRMSGAKTVSLPSCRNSTNTMRCIPDLGSGLS